MGIKTSFIAEALKKEATIHILGEVHSDPASIKAIHDYLVEIKPQFLLHELLYTDVCKTSSEIKSRLKDCREGEICDPTLNIDIYQFGLDYNVQLIGIDLDNPDLALLSLKEQFRLRENHMLSVIRKHIELHGNKQTAIVVGDAHLRTYRSDDFGTPSPLNKLREDNRVIIIRALKSKSELL